ncbi:unnamed protein product [Mytilus coruscus]|uniref:Uncharacterized protein n=1 Tax=Mytilus coruscus TaxID=42192 RepID=A0A6J7ZVC7_MYTCO|nr:unnamed protein product [Mytilus coruscus]
MESSLSDSDSDHMEYRTPKKKRYRSSIHHGFSKRTAKYHKVSPDKYCRSNTSRSTRPLLSKQHLDKSHGTANSHSQKVSQDNAMQGSEIDFGQTDEPHVHVQEQEIDQGELEESSESCSISLTDEEEASSLSDISELNSSSSDDFLMDHSTTDCSDENSGTENSSRDNVAKPLYDGCELTQYKAYILIMLYVTKNSLSRDGFEELLQMLSVLLPPSSILTTSVYQLKDTLKKNLGYNEPIQHFYCQNCQQLLKDKSKCLRESCQREKAQVLEFYDLGMTQQLKNFFQDDNFMKAIKKQQRKAENLNEELTDIVQGQRYKEVVPKNNGADMNLTLTLNTGYYLI